MTSTKLKQYDSILNSAAGAHDAEPEVHSVTAASDVIAAGD